ncbi:MAG: hypothetical protein J4N76_11760 [Chloroflexi bacterium]|nr:hypothetical protein [Chloroflexota bacterium]MCI0877221.1 hypothetical protein [Chloroflexota bacterium]MCI0893124.1 hypothetical protein [Chloroflexota bacterium]
MNFTLIYVILGVTTVALIVGWFYSERTRGLVKFALILIAFLGALVFTIDFVIRTWFPYRPF